MRLLTCVATFAGTASAKIEARVAAADATAWCARWNAAHEGRPEDQVAQGGTGGGAKFRSPTYIATANCTTGDLKAVDGRSHKFAGSRVDGQGAAHVPNGSTSICQLAPDPNAGGSLAMQWELLCAGARPPK